MVSEELRPRSDLGLHCLPLSSHKGTLGLYENMIIDRSLFLLAFHKANVVILLPYGRRRCRCIISYKGGI